MLKGQAQELKESNILTWGALLVLYGIQRSDGGEETSVIIWISPRWEHQFGRLQHRQNAQLVAAKHFS